MDVHLIDEAVVDLAVLNLLLLILAAGCAVADHVFPKVPFIRRYLDSLPEYEDDSKK